MNLPKSFQLACVVVLAFLLVGCGPDKKSDSSTHSNATSNTDSNGTEESESTDGGLAVVADAETVSLNVDFGSEKSPFNVTVDWNADMTLLSLMSSAGLDVDYSGKGKTAFVKGISGIEGGKEGRGWWIYKVDGKMVKKGADVYVLKPGDNVQWLLGDYDDEEQN